MTIDEFNINNKNHILIVRKVIQMLTLVPESLALYPLEKHFQRENETGQPGYANISCRGAMPATNLDRTLGRTLFFFLILNLGSSGVVERPKIGPGTLRRPCPYGSFQTSCPRTFLQGRRLLQRSSVLPVFPISFPISGGSTHGQGGIAISEGCVRFAGKQPYLHESCLFLSLSLFVFVCVCYRAVAWLRCDSASWRQGLSFFSQDDIIAECHTPPGKKMQAWHSDSHSCKQWRPLGGLSCLQKGS